MCLRRMFSAFLKYLTANTISVLILISTNGPGLKCMRSAKQHTDISMCSRLIITGEVKIDIRLLISMESKERLERNILTIFRGIFNPIAASTLE